jgi:hypothetical protein
MTKPQHIVTTQQTNKQTHNKDWRTGVVMLGDSGEHCFPLSFSILTTTILFWDKGIWGWFYLSVTRQCRVWKASAVGRTHTRAFVKGSEVRRIKLWRKGDRTSFHMLWGFREVTQILELLRYVSLSLCFIPNPTPNSPRSPMKIMRMTSWYNANTLSDFRSVRTNPKVIRSFLHPAPQSRDKQFWMPLKRAYFTRAYRLCGLSPSSRFVNRTRRSGKSIFFRPENLSCPIYHLFPFLSIHPSFSSCWSPLFPPSIIFFSS